MTSRTQENAILMITVLLEQKDRELNQQKGETHRPERVPHSFSESSGCVIWVLGLKSVEIDKRPDEKFRQGFTGAPAVARGSENKQEVPLLAPRGRWGVGVGVCVSWSLKWGLR